MELVMGTHISEIDALATEIYGISGLQLMENAGRAVADLAEAISTKPQAVILVGSGNNGGDALVVARHLANRGWQIELFLLVQPEAFKNDTKTNWEIIKKLGLQYTVITDDFKPLEQAVSRNCLIIDGIFGTGFRGEPDSFYSEIFSIINNSTNSVLAIDIPSGVNATTGQVEGTAIYADYTITFGWAKYGLRVFPGKNYAGNLKIADISLPKALWDRLDKQIIELDLDYVKATLPKREKDSHKGSYGHCVVLGGSQNMQGAPILTAGSALRSGAGLVTLASLPNLATPLICQHPEIMLLPLPESQGFISETSIDTLRDLIKDKVIILGMGLGRNPNILKLVSKICQLPSLGMVIDADALWALSSLDIDFKNANFPVVLTPHPKEMAMLLGKTTEHIQQNRLQAVMQAAEKYQADIVLKGADTLICQAATNKIWLNPTGNPGMATGGSGDVLAGIIGSLMAQNIENAASVGVYLHGLAGDLAKEQLGEYALSAGDIRDYLAQALKIAES